MLLLGLAHSASGQALQSCQPLWLPTFGPNTNNVVFALAGFDDGGGPALHAGGGFTQIGGLPANFVAKWNGSGWSALAGGTSDRVRCLAVFDDGSGAALYAGGEFGSAGGVPVDHIARWNGSSWSALAGGTNNWVLSLAVFDDGSGPALYAGGLFTSAGGSAASRIAKWNGTSWSALAGGLNDSPQALCVFDDGSGPALYAAGVFTSAGGAGASRIAKWNGTSWSALGSGMNHFVLSLAVFDDGAGQALYAGGEFTLAGGVPASRIAKWNGALWSALGSGVDFPSIPTLTSVRCLSVFDDGGGPALIAGGFFSLAGGSAAAYIAQWNGSAWSGLGSGLSGYASGAALFDSGHGPALFVGGGFSNAFDSGDAHLARWACPSTSSTPICFGDGSLGPCPCGNSGISAHGCENSAGTGGARLSGSGTTSPDAYVLGSSAELPSALSIFLQGSLEIAPVPFGDGLRCAGGSLKRLFVKNATSGTSTAPDFAAGDPTLTRRSATLGDPLSTGSVRVYQVYYRDPDPAYCASPAGNTWNVSNGLRLTW